MTQYFRLGQLSIVLSNIRPSKWINASLASFDLAKNKKIPKWEIFLGKRRRLKCNISLLTQIEQNKLAVFEDEM